MDYFGEALEEDKYKKFKSVIKPDLAEVHKEVLKAMLLLDIAELPTKKAGGYAAVIANLTGLEEAAAKRTLQALAEQHYITHDDHNDTYSFASIIGIELEKLLDNEIKEREDNKKLRVLFDEFTSGTNPVNNLLLTQKYPVTVSWGHSDDWAAQEILVSASGLNQSVIEALRTRYSVEIGKAPKSRGAVALVIPKSQGEANEAAAKITSLLSASDKDKLAPMLFLVPQEGQKSLYENLIKLALLNEPYFKSKVQPIVGSTAISDRADKLTGSIQKALEALRLNSTLILPPSVTPSWNARTKPRLANRISEALKHTYELAYPNHPDSFFTHLGLSTNNLTIATMYLIPDLIENTLDKDKVVLGGAKKVAEDLQNILQKDWKIINLNKQLINPDLTKIKIAWERLQRSFSTQLPNSTAEEVFKELLHPPYGYDTNTLALLFSAWYGMNSHSISLAGANIGRAALSDKKIYKNPGQFLELISKARIQVRDMEKERIQIDLLISRIRNPHKETEALEILRAFKDFIGRNPKYDPAYLSKVSRAIDKLEIGISNSHQYDEFVIKFESDLKRASIHDISGLYKRLEQGAPELTTVTATKDELPALSAKLLDHTEELLNEFLQKTTRLTEVTQYTERLNSITRVKNVLANLGLTDLKARADEGVVKLLNEKAALEAEQDEKSDLKIVRNFQITGNLRDLRETASALTAFRSKSSLVNDIAQDKHRQITDAIAHLEGQLPNWQKALETVLDAKAAGQLSKDLLSQGSKYEGTPEAERMTALQGQAEALNRFFNVLSSTTPLRGASRQAGMG